jgi:hypothetical protein
VFKLEVIRADQMYFSTSKNQLGLSCTGTLSNPYARDDWQRDEHSQTGVLQRTPETRLFNKFNWLKTMRRLAIGCRNNVFGALDRRLKAARTVAE